MRKYVLIALVMISCSTQEDSVSKIHDYFSLDSLVSVHVNLLAQANPRIRKKVELNGETEDTVLQFNREEWENELKLFIEADINVPSYSGVYELENRLDDPNSNLKFDRYLPKEDNEVRIRSIEIYYYQTIDQIKKVRIEELEENGLYYSSKMLELTFTNDHNRSVISGYKITGLQKLITRDSVRFKIEGSVL